MNDLGTSTALTERARQIAGQVAGTSRRGIMCGAFGVSAAAVLAACGGTEDTGSGKGEDTAKDDKSSDGGKELAKLEDIPVGGGIVTDSLVIVQATEGSVKAFDRACTHRGAPIEAPKDGIMLCPKHQSEFKMEDGSAAGGPAKTPLNEVEVRLKDGKIFQA